MQYLAPILARLCNKRYDYEWIGDVGFDRANNKAPLPL